MEAAGFETTLGEERVSGNLAYRPIVGVKRR